MHVLHVIDKLSVGGAERMLIDIANQSHADGQAVSVCLTRSDAGDRFGLHPDIPLYGLQRTRRFELKAVLQLNRIVRERKIDICHGHGRPTCSFLAFAKTMGALPADILMHDHFGAIETDRSVPRWFRHWGRHMISRYVGVSPLLGEWASAAGVPATKVRVVENAIDLQRIRTQAPPDLRASFAASDEQLGLVIAGIRLEKGIDTLLDAIAHARLSKVKIVVAGGARDQSYLSFCLEKVRTLGLDNTVVFAGERPDVPALLACADFALVTARSESGPLVLIEYMATGLPFVSTLVGSIARRAAALGATEFVPPDQPAMLGEAIRRLVALRPEERARRVQQGREIASRYFDIREQISQWYGLYQELGVAA